MLVETLKALSDESRLKIALALKAGPLNVQELTEVLDIAQPTVSHHLKVLSSAGVVMSEKSGTFAYYRLRNGSSPASTLTSSILAISEKHSLAELAQVKSRVDTLLLQRREQAKSFFDSVAPQWKELRSTVQGDESFLPLLTGLIDPSASLVELGCGSGSLFEEILPRPGKTIGIDYSEPMLEMARKALGAKAAQVDLRLGYLEHLPVETNSVDVAVSHMVLHHIVDPKLVLKDSFRILRSGGRLLVIDLTSHHREEMREKFADLWMGFDPSELQAWGAELGFGQCRTELLGRGKAFLLEAVKN